MSIKNLAKELSTYGRRGDTLLMHVTPDEVAGLQAIAKSQGTTLTTNPHTGLPEAFNMGTFLKQMAPTLAGAGMMMIPGGQVAGLSAMQAGIAAGALTGAALNKDDPLMGAVMGGFGGYGGANLASSALGMGSAGASGGSSAAGGASSGGSGAVAGGTGAVGNTSQSAAGVPSFDVAPMNAQGPGIQLQGGQTPGFATDASLDFAPKAAPIQGGFDSLAQQTTQPPSFTGNLNQAYQNVSNNPMEFLDKNKFGIGIPVGMAALSASQPEGMPLVEDKYDPYATLNLGGPSSRNESGLRLLAGGGPVSFADGGLTPTIQSGGLQDLYGSRDDQTAGMQISRDGYGMGRLQAMAEGGVAGYAKGGYLDGPGDGMSDSIPATIEGKQPARLADGEFVIPADVVSHLGNGSTKAGSTRLYAMLDKVRKARTGTKKQGKQINPNKYMPA